MSKYTVHWVNDHAEICDRLDERVQLMQDYFNSKPDNFDGIAAKWLLDPGFRSCLCCGLDAILTMTKGTSPMLVKLQTADYLIYAKLDKTQRVTDLALKNRIPSQTCYAILHEIEACGDSQITWDLADDGHSDTVRVSRSS